MRHGTREREKLVKPTKTIPKSRKKRRQPMYIGRLEGLEWVEEQREQRAGQGDRNEKDRMEVWRRKVI